MPLPLSLLAAALLSTAAATQPGSSGAEEGLLVAKADGSWTITAAIQEEPVSLADLTDGLLEDEAPLWPPASGRDRMREEEADAQAERAFEEALDAVQSAGPGR